jgi:hypothetical protein
MLRICMSLAVLLLLVTPPAFAGEPEINVGAVCHARTADAKDLQIPPDQSDEDCVRDEESAKQQLGRVWASTSDSIKNRCQAEARSLGTSDYFDLLSCLQIAEDLRSIPKKEDAIDGAAATTLPTESIVPAHRQTVP